MVGQILIFLIIMTVFCRVNFFQNLLKLQDFLKSFLFVSKDKIDHMRINIQYNILNKKSSRLKWCFNFQDILIRTEDIHF